MEKDIASHLTIAGLWSQGFSLTPPSQGSERALGRQRKEEGKNWSFWKTLHILLPWWLCTSRLVQFNQLCSSPASPPQWPLWWWPWNSWGERKPSCRWCLHSCRDTSDSSRRCPETRILSLLPLSPVTSDRAKGKSLKLCQEWFRFRY